MNCINQCLMSAERPRPIASVFDLMDHRDVSSTGMTASCLSSTTKSSAPDSKSTFKGTSGCQDCLSVPSNRSSHVHSDARPANSHVWTCRGCLRHSRSRDCLLRGSQCLSTVSYSPQEPLIPTYAPS